MFHFHRHMSADSEKPTTTGGIWIKYCTGAKRMGPVGPTSVEVNGCAHARRLCSATKSTNSDRHILESGFTERCANDSFLTSFRATLNKFLPKMFWTICLIKLHLSTRFVFHPKTPLVKETKMKVSGKAGMQAYNLHILHFLCPITSLSFFEFWTRKNGLKIANQVLEQDVAGSGFHHQIRFWLIAQTKNSSPKMFFTVFTVSSVWGQYFHNNQFSVVRTFGGQQEHF